jgi:anion-transporting  ArsA/GET3 family ATPase
VGKTTVAAVTAGAAAASGLRTLLVGLDSGTALGESFGRDSLTASRVDIAHNLQAQIVVPDLALRDWLADKRMGRLADRLASSGALDMIATAVPGIRDILVLGRIKALINEANHDVIVVDGPASGHAVSMLQTATGLRESVSVGAIRQQADEVAAMLADPAITQVLLVTLPEQTPVTETIETAFALEDRVGVRLGPILVNQVDGQRAAMVDTDALGGSTRQFVFDQLAREATQQAMIRRLKTELPIPVVELSTVRSVSAEERRKRLQQELMEWAP